MAEAPRTIRKPGDASGSDVGKPAVRYAPVVDRTTQGVAIPLALVKGRLLIDRSLVSCYSDSV